LCIPFLQKKAILARGFYEDKEKDSSLKKLTIAESNSNT